MVVPRQHSFEARRQRWSRGHKARGQGQGHKKNPRPRPRTAFPRTDTLEAKDRNARGQGQGHQRKCSPKSQKFFRRSQKKKKKGLHKNFSSGLQKKTFSKKFFKRFTKFWQFKKYCCPRAEDRPIFEDLRPRGQGQGLDLRGQGQGLQNVSSRTSSRPRTSSRTPPLTTIIKSECDT